MAPLPGDPVGEHRIAAYAADGSLIGWDVVAITSDEPGDPGDDDGRGTPGDDDRPRPPGDEGEEGTPGDDGPGAPGEASEQNVDRADRAASGSEHDGAAGSQPLTSRLPETGVSPVPVALIALTALLTGVALVLRRSARP